MYICIYVCMYICIYVYMYICICIYIYVGKPYVLCDIYLGHVYTCVFVYIHICIYVYMYIFTYMCGLYECMLFIQAM